MENTANVDQLVRTPHFAQDFLESGSVNSVKGFFQANQSHEKVLMLLATLFVYLPGSKDHVKSLVIRPHWLSGRHRSVIVHNL